MADPESLVIFDYSGTLSLAAPRFARPDHLLRQLDECGLSALGIDQADIFWQEIVNPTWDGGQYGPPVGYAALMADRINMRRAGKSGTRAGEDAARAAAALFVSRYLAYSVIDPRWETLLARLTTAWPATMAMVATDHYAEATHAVIGHLEDRRVRGAALRDMKGRERVMAVANSADLGAHKAEPLFWETVGQELRLRAVRRILIVDDWGANEQAADAYGMADLIARRRANTLAMLEEVFRAPVMAVDFTFGGPDAAALPKQDVGVLIERTASAVTAFLAG